MNRQELSRDQAFRQAVGWIKEWHPPDGCKNVQVFPGAYFKPDGTLEAMVMCNNQNFIHVFGGQGRPINRETIHAAFDHCVQRATAAAN